MATFAISQSSGFWSPAVEFSKVFGQALKEPGHGKVKVTEFKAGEKVANLPDSLENRRSVAAMLAKKYRREHPKLAAAYASMKKRALDDSEVELIFSLVGKLRENGQKAD